MGRESDDEKKTTTTQLQEFCRKDGRCLHRGNRAMRKDNDVFSCFSHFCFLSLEVGFCNNRSGQSLEGKSPRSPRSGNRLVEWL